MIDTIAAIATPLGEGGIGIIRLSGPESLKILKKIFRRTRGQERGQESFKSHYLYHGWVLDPQGQEFLDEVLASYMQGPKSYTGEDVVEVSCHGGIAILKQVLEMAIREGARLADRGEFTKRAFLNGRLDLMQAEAVIDLIKAPTKESTLAAAKQLKGRLSKEIKALREELLSLLAEIEASIDFPDEIEGVDHGETEKRAKSAIHRIEEVLSTADTGRVLREGVATVIVGRPNVGKSSLLNTLLREERAIVTEIPGTTRDTIQEVVNVKGLPLRIIDTAGLQRAKDKIEELGVERTTTSLSRAELALIVIDGSENLTEEDLHILKLTKGKKAIVVLNKADKPLCVKEQEIKTHLDGVPQVRISALYGTGLGELEEIIVETIVSQKILAENRPILTNVRHKECLERAKESLDKVLDSTHQRLPSDFVAIDLKEAIVALGEVTGETVSEEVINRIFEEFCVGK